MTAVLWYLISRVFAVICAGILVGRYSRRHVAAAAPYFVRFALYILVPAFVLVSLWAGPLSVVHAKRIMLAALFVVAAGGAYAVVWCRWQGIPLRTRVLPVMFMNSAYLAVPVNTLLWGETGAMFAIMYSAMITVTHFTVGVGLIADRRSRWDIASLPVLGALIAGFALNGFSVPLPGWVAAVNRPLTEATTAVMLLFVGYRVADMKVVLMGDVCMAVLLRMAGGLAAGYAAIHVFSLSGPAAGVCLMTSSMPAAFNSYLLAETYDSDARFVSSAIVLGLGFSVIVIPLVALLTR